MFSCHGIFTSIDNVLFMKGLYHRNVLFTKYPRHLKCFENASTHGTLLSVILVHGLTQFFHKTWYQRTDKTSKQKSASYLCYKFCNLAMAISLNACLSVNTFVPAGHLFSQSTKPQVGGDYNSDTHNLKCKEHICFHMAAHPAWRAWIWYIKEHKAVHWVFASIFN